MRPPRIIDAHHHLWDLDRIYYPWLTDEIVPDFLFGEYAKIRKNYLPEDMRAQMRGWNVEMTVHVEAERADGERLKETAWLSEMHERFRLPNAIIGHVWLADPDVEGMLRQHMQYPLFRGVRSKPRTGKTARQANLMGPATMSDPQWRSGSRRIHSNQGRDPVQRARLQKLSAPTIVSVPMARTEAARKSLIACARRSFIELRSTS